MKFQEMFDQAMHHALINQSKVMMNYVQNIVHQMMSGQWTPGNIGPVHSQAESSAAAATRVAASLATDIGFQPMAECAAQAGAGFAPMPPAFFQPLAFFSMGTQVQMVPTSTSTSPSMATPAKRNLFSTPHEYVPPSSLGMPPEIMVSPSPDASNSGGHHLSRSSRPRSPARWFHSNSHRRHKFSSREAPQYQHRLFSRWHCTCKILLPICSSRQLHDIHVGLPATCGG